MTDETYQHEGERAKTWRTSIGLTRKRLAELTGYGESTINAIERGRWSRGQDIDAATMRAYRLACAAVALGVRFDWGDIELEPMQVQVTVPARIVSRSAADRWGDLFEACAPSPTLPGREPQP